MDEEFVMSRREDLNRYLQNVLSDARVAESHEVWDFLSQTSTVYAYKTDAELAGNARYDLIGQM
jgi:hypothetical protein